MLASTRRTSVGLY